MKRNDQCLACLVNQVIKVAHMIDAKDKDGLYQKVFDYLSHVDLNKTNPEMIGDTFDIIKDHTRCLDPYYDVRKYYNELFMKQSDQFYELINNSDDSFLEAIKYAIIGNIIDFNPMHNINSQDIMKVFDEVKNRELVIDDTNYLKKDIVKAQTLLYLGDNCGEICLDKLLIQEILKINPHLHIYFGVRGTPVINDSIEEDAYFVGMDDYATIISNGDQSLGTILSRVSEEFQNVYQKADIVIAKGQANYESLSDENKNIYFLLMSKCEVIAKDIGVSCQSLICLRKK